jgi:AraC family transcriptional regulator
MIEQAVTPKIELLAPKNLVGIRMKMSLIQNKTGILWHTMISRLGEIQNRVSNDLISLQNYDPTYFQHFDASNQFEKWAAVEVREINQIPQDMESFHLPGGAYAVFEYKGSNLDAKIYEYIFREWLPSSSFQLDHRPHFEVLGEKYKNNDPESEEEIWIPIREK